MGFTPDDKPSLSLVKCRHLPIYDQLQLEEALLRADKRNWCIINEGTSPAVVMGISGVAANFVDQERMQRDPIPLIKRFSGGGTVYVDGGTHFITWIWNSADINVPCCPCSLHQWTSNFYQKALPQLSMRLQENDYVIHDRKWGGNAQYLCKGRWLHHTSMLWDFNPDAMLRLLIPPKVPTYRQSRPHHEFLCRLSDHLPERKMLDDAVVHLLHESFFVNEVSLEEAQSVMILPHRKSTHYVKSVI